MKLSSMVAIVMVTPMIVTAQAPAAAGQPPATQPPATPTPATPTPAAPPARLPFPAGATHAYLDLQRVASESRVGAAANQRVQALRDQKVAEINAGNAQVQANQQTLQQNANVMSQEAQLQLQRDINRGQVAIERMTQDAEAELQELEQMLQVEFNQQLLPSIERVGVDRGLQFIYSIGDGGLVWANPALDVTDDVVRALDAAQTP